MCPHLQLEAMLQVPLLEFWHRVSGKDVHARGAHRAYETHSLYNLNIANTYGKPVEQSQAIALSVEEGQFGAYACKFTGYQDTLLAETGTQFYGRSYIEGYATFMNIRLYSSSLRFIGPSTLSLANMRPSGLPSLQSILLETVLLLHLGVAQAIPTTMLLIALPFKGRGQYILGAPGGKF